MEPWIPLVMVVVAVVGCIVAQRQGWIDLSNKSRTSGAAGGMMGAVNEVFAPSQYEAQLERDRQTVLPAPAPLPGDPAAQRAGSVYTGRVQIDLASRPDADRSPMA